MSQPSDTPEARGSNLYYRGNTVAFACKKDPRFSYVMYVPENLGEADSDPPDLIVCIHGTGRTNVLYRDSFTEFGRYNNCVVVAPLFPVGVLGDENRNGFKYIQEADIRYDEVVLAIVSEVEARLSQNFPRFLMFGYSGGGHFVHRFAYLHPERLSAVCVGAPGSVTLIDETRDWWVGTRDIKQRFGRDIDMAALRDIEFLVTVGGADLETWEITHRPGSTYWMEGANDAGATRGERAKTLVDSLKAHGVTAGLTVVPNVAHDMEGVLHAVKDFFFRHLRKTRGQKQR